MGPGGGSRETASRRVAGIGVMTMYESAKNYRARFLRDHGDGETMIASVHGKGARIEAYSRYRGDWHSIVIVLVDDRDRKIALPFDHASFAEGFVNAGTAYRIFRGLCKMYGLNDRSVRNALRKLRSYD